MKRTLPLLLRRGGLLGLAGLCFLRHCVISGWNGLSQRDGKGKRAETEAEKGVGGLGTVSVMVTRWGGSGRHINR